MIWLSKEKMHFSYSQLQNATEVSVGVAVRSVVLSQLRQQMASVSD